MKKRSAHPEEVRDEIVERFERRNQRFGGLLGLHGIVEVGRGDALASCSDGRLAVGGLIGAHGGTLTARRARTQVSCEVKSTLGAMAATTLEAAQVRRRLDPAALPFDTTAELPPLRGTIGQDRALDAIDFGLEVATSGYNLFVAGAAGSGRESTILDCLERAAAERPAPDDLVYAHNFAEPGNPRALRLPAGRGCDLRRDLDELLAAAREEIPRAFEGEEFEARRQQALAEVQRRHEQITEDIQRAARERGFQIQQTPGGLVSVPVRDGQPLPPAAIERLSEEERAELQRRAGELNELVGASMRQMRRLDQEVGERTRSVGRDMARD